MARTVTDTRVEDIIKNKSNWKKARYFSGYGKL